MPWCPVCKNEYREGFTTCAECKVELVANFEDIPVVIYSGVEQVAQLMVQYLKKEDYEDASMSYDNNKEVYHVCVKSANEKSAKRALKDFEAALYSQCLNFADIGLCEDGSAYMGETMEADYTNDMASSERAAFVAPTKASTDALSDDASQMIDELEERQNAASNPIPLQVNHMQLMKEAEKRKATSVYQNKHDKAEEYKSSAGALMIVGVLGLALIVVNELGLLPIALNFNKPLVYGVMGTVFVFFIIASIFSMTQYKKALQYADEEDQLVNKIKEFMESQTVKNQILDGEKNADKHSDEDLYFVRAAKMKRMLMEQFPEAEEALVDKMVDDFYEEWFA